MSHLRMISESVCALRRADSVQFRLTSANLGFFNSEVDACLLERVMETNGTEPRKIRVLDQLLRFRKASVCLVDQYHFTPGPEALQQPRRLIPLGRDAQRKMCRACLLLASGEDPTGEIRLVSRGLADAERAASSTRASRTRSHAAEPLILEYCPVPCSPRCY